MERGRDMGAQEVGGRYPQAPTPHTLECAYSFNSLE